MSLKLYYDLMSQPSRMLYILFKTGKCNFEPKLINIGKGQQFSDEYTAINRFQKLPAIDHNGFVLMESVAIVKYLSRENIIPDSLYPKDNKLQARVDEYLEWQHIGLRAPCSLFFKVTFIDPMLLGKKPGEKLINKHLEQMSSAIELFEDKWLNNGTEFVAGNTVTVADLLAACELEQPRITGYDPAAHFKGVSSWWDKVRNHFNPYYDEAHVVIKKVAAFHQKSQAKL